MHCIAVHAFPCRIVCMCSLCCPCIHAQMSEPARAKIDTIRTVYNRGMCLMTLHQIHAMYADDLRYSRSCQVQHLQGQLIMHVWHCQWQQLGTNRPTQSALTSTQAAQLRRRPETMQPAHIEHPLAHLQPRCACTGHAATRAAHEFGANSARTYSSSCNIYAYTSSPQCAIERHEQHSCMFREVAHRCKMLRPSS